MYLEGLNPEKTKGKKKPTKAALVHPLEVFCSFEVLSLSPPAVITDLEASIAGIKTRKENFLKLQAEQIKERQEQKKLQAEAKEAAAKAEQEKKLAEATETKNAADSSVEVQPAEVETKPEASTPSEDHKPTETPETKTETPAEQPPAADSPATN